MGVNRLLMKLSSGTLPQVTTIFFVISFHESIIMKNKVSKTNTKEEESPARVAEVGESARDTRACVR